MRIYGDLMNRLMETAEPITPVKGMGATVLMYSDRHAATVTAVGFGGNWLTVQYDTATRTDAHGMSDVQEYTYTPNPQGIERTFTRRKNGKWIAKGESMKNGTVLLLGKRNEYYDYGF